MRLVIEGFSLRNVKSGTGRLTLDIVVALSSFAEVVVVTRDPDPDLLSLLPDSVEIIYANRLPFVPTIIYLFLFFHLDLKPLNFDRVLFTIGLKPLFLKNKFDLLICDFNHIIFPKSLPLISRIIYRLGSAASISRAALVLAISDGTSTKSERYYNRGADLIINPSVGKFVGVTPRAVENLDNFSIYVGAIEPRKNIKSLIAAHDFAYKSGIISDQLLLISSQSWFVGDISQIIAVSDSVSILSDISEAELSWLYANAQRVYMTTYYEGFGMPAMEAVYHGSRLICTDIPELREASVGEALYTETDAIGILTSIVESASSEKGTADVNATREMLEQRFVSQINEYARRLGEAS
jgi:glycosyltransferase involved in cell wall biosynthesis